jgi:hypothetical protein
MLFYVIYPVDLASHSSALTPYETSNINRFHLASYVWLDYLAAQVLDAFHIWPSQSLLCWLCCWIKFCSTQYNTPRTFCLASYSVVFCDRCNNVSQRVPLTTQTAYKPLGATLRTNTLPFLIPVNWLVLYGSQHHLLLFMHPGSLAGQSIHILSHTSALLLQPPVLSVIATSR